LALAWLEQRIRLTRKDKGGGTVYNPDIDAAWRAMDKATSLFRKGDASGAKPFAEEALKQLEACY